MSGLNNPSNSSRVVHKSTGGTLHSIPEPVDLVGNAASLLSNTVAQRTRRVLRTGQTKHATDRSGFRARKFASLYAR